MEVRNTKRIVEHIRIDSLNFLFRCLKDLGILIPRQLTIEQYIKLFSNPVSGIACEVDAYNHDHRVNYHCKNIRYSKSMILRALKFWLVYTAKYYIKISSIYNPLINFKSQLEGTLSELRGLIVYIKKELPDSFLFSHRYIEPGNFKDYSDDTPCALLKKKYPIIKKDQPLWIQKGKRDIFFDIHLRDLGISFTVFPNEHPYIPRQKITRVGMTEKGNVYIMMDNGAQKNK
jgi:hypothetical protein